MTLSVSVSLCASHAKRKEARKEEKKEEGKVWNIILLSSSTVLYFSLCTEKTSLELWHMEHTLI